MLPRTTKASLSPPQRAESGCQRARHGWKDLTLPSRHPLVNALLEVEDNEVLCFLCIPGR